MIKHRRRLFKANRFLSDKRTLAVIFILIVVFGCLAVNFVFNVIINLFDIARGRATITAGYIFDFDKKYLLVYVIALIILIIIALMNTYRFRTAYSDMNVGQKGTQRWAETSELKQQYKAVPEKDKRYSGRGGVPVSRFGHCFLIEDSPAHFLIIGITRSGKGQCFILPTIDIYSRAEYQPSLIVNDPKLELARASKDKLEERGYEVHVLNLIEFDKNSMGYNPLSLIAEKWIAGDEDEAELLARTLCNTIFNEESAGQIGKDKFFAQTATYLLTALILAHIEDCVKYDCTEKINMYSLVNLFIELSDIQSSDGKQTGIDYYFKSRPTGNRAKLQYGSSKVAGDRTKGSIFATMLSQMTLFTLTRVGRLTSRSTLDISKIGFGDKPVAVFMGIPDFDTSNHFIASMFVSQVYYELAKRSTANGGKCEREVVFLLDEFGNMPPIGSMDSIISVSAGRGMYFDLVIQNYSQLESKYGKQTAQTIRANCANQIYLLTNEAATAEEFSSLLGDETIMTVTRSGTKLSTKKTFVESYDQRRLIDKNELMKLAQGANIVQRVVKRTDLKGRDITPYPVFNIDETRFPFAWTYLDGLDTNRVLPPHAFAELPQIELDKLVLDCRRVFEDLMSGKYYGGSSSTAAVSMEFRRTTVSEAVGNDDKLSIISNIIGMDVDAFRDMTTGEFKTMIAEMTVDSDITGDEADTILGFLG